MAKDLYAVLGLSKGASPEEIKRAYRQMSKEWHPDKHKGDKTAEDTFKSINEAYETLGDAQKKQSYDQFGTTGNQQGGGGQGFGGFDFSGFQGGTDQFSDLGDLFGNFFGGGSSGRTRQTDRNRGNDREIELTITLADVVTGIQDPIEFKRQNLCDVCSGNGAEPGSKVVQCPTCKGTGQVTRTVNSFFGQIQQATVCPTCTGSGSMPEKNCHKCGGEGRLNEKVRRRY
jgi:molecular chaperone DnaJ